MVKVVLITGGNTGIGKATAIEFANKGYDVIITYLMGSYDFLDKEYTAIKADITKQKDIDKIVSIIKKKYGKLDILVNNAGILKHSNIKNLTVEDWRKTFEVNLFGMFNVSKNCLSVLKKGCIINVASIRGIEAAPHDMDYSASKAGVINFTKALAKELSPKIRVNSISPGITKTNLVRYYQKVSKKTASKTLLKRMADPKEIAHAIVFLAENEYITGQNLIVDGGYSIN